MQPFTPTANEIGDDTSQTYQLGDVFMRNVITGEACSRLCCKIGLKAVPSLRLWEPYECSFAAAADRV